MITLDVALAALILSISSSSSAQDQSGRQPTRHQQSPSRKEAADPQQPKYLKAFVIDDRLSVLRRDPQLLSEALHRLRLGRPVFIVGTSNPRLDQPKFYRVAVTRRTRGWIHASALAIPGRVGEDQRILYLVEHNSEGFERVVLCKLLSQQFARSRLIPRALYLYGEEATRLAQTLSQRAQRRLAPVSMSGVKLRDYYLSDAALDRFSKLGVVFNYDESSGEFVYDGKVYRELIRRFPNSEEAKLARERLATN